MEKKPKKTTIKKKVRSPTVFEDLERLASLMAQYDLGEIEVRTETTDRRTDYKLRRASSLPKTLVESTPVGLTVQTGGESTRPQEVEESGVFVTSPLVGTFYRAPSPDAPPFVEPGTRIRPGQKLCIIEAMKLMNEIEAEVDGAILDILVENGKPVEYGQKLFRVKPH